MKEVTFVVWNASQEELELANKIKDYFISLFDSDISVKIDDLKNIGETTYENLCVVFGTTAKNYINHDVLWEVPALSTMLPGEGYVKNKRSAMRTLRRVAEELKTEKEEIPITTHLETPQGVTVGSEGYDINITEQEVDHLKNLKKILGGGKMVVIKGDIRIEVE